MYSVSYRFGRTIKFAIAGASVALALAATPAHAVVLAPGDTDLGGTSLASRPELAGTVVAPDLTLPYTIQSDTGAITSGTVINSVVRENATGTIDLYFRVIPDRGGSFPTDVFRLGGYAGYTFDVDYRTDSIGDTKVVSAHLFDGDFAGYINFFLDGAGVEFPSQSYAFFVKTNAHEFNQTAFADLYARSQGAMSNGFNIYGPAGPIPEPASDLLLAMAAPLLLARRRRA